MPSAGGSTEEHQVPLKEEGRRGGKETEEGLGVGWVLLKEVSKGCYNRCTGSPSSMFWVGGFLSWPLYGLMAR